MLNISHPNADLLNEIAVLILNFCNIEDKESHISNWYINEMTTEQLVERLLPLCKLLNRLFFTIDCERSLEIVD